MKPFARAANRNAVLVSTVLLDIAPQHELLGTSTQRGCVVQQSLLID
jgi:hypothetical protein